MFNDIDLSPESVLYRTMFILNQVVPNALNSQFVGFVSQDTMDAMLSSLKKVDVIEKDMPEQDTAEDKELNFNELNLTVRVRHNDFVIGNRISITHVCLADEIVLFLEYSDTNSLAIHLADQVVELRKELERVKSKVEQIERMNYI